MLDSNRTSFHCPLGGIYGSICKAQELDAEEDPQALANFVDEIAVALRTSSFEYYFIYGLGRRSQIREVGKFEVEDSLF